MVLRGSLTSSWLADSWLVPELAHDTNRWDAHAAITFDAITYHPITYHPITYHKVRAQMLHEDAQLQVKDCKLQTLKTMNARQIDKLTAEQITAIGEGLAPYAEAVGELGYSIR